MKVKTSHTLDEKVLQKVQAIKVAENRPSESNTIEVLIQEALEARKKKKAK
jgi:hypothetical protein